MNGSLLFGFLMVVLTVWFGVMGSAPRKDIFLDPHALLLVVGGTLAAAFIAFPLERLRRVVKLVIDGIVLKKRISDRDLVSELVLLTSSLRKDHGKTFASQKAIHPLVSEAVFLIVTHGFDKINVQTVLHSRLEGVKKMYEGDAKLLGALSKFPPAFGLLGASSGMITMMLNLNSGGIDGIGPAMAIALVATLWGIAVANFVLLPLAEHAKDLAADEMYFRKIIVEWAVLICDEHSEVIVTETLNGFLAINDRLNVYSTRFGFKN